MQDAHKRAGFLVSGSNLFSNDAPGFLIVGANLLLERVPRFVIAVAYLFAKLRTRDRKFSAHFVPKLHYLHFERRHTLRQST